VIGTINSLASLNEITTTQVSNYVGVLADRNPINAVANWITSKPWDGKDRLPDICNTLTVQEGYPVEFKDVLMKKWLLSAVAAATLPSGFHSRGILTLQGLQGSGKTSWVRSLIPGGILRDNVILTGHVLDPSNKDSVTTAIKHWIVEIGELDSSFRKDVARLKGFITQDKDKLRRPYAITDSEYSRRTVFCATVNEVNFLIDKTGNSRFWVIPVTSIDYNHKVDMLQVFALLHVELQNGATWWLPPEENARLEELNRDHRAVSVVEEKLLDAFDFDLPADRWSNLSATEVLEYIGYQRPTNPLCRECGGILRDHVGQPKKSHGIAKWKVPLGTVNTRSL
jgi:putative DNA primase/helicase